MTTGPESVPRGRGSVDDSTEKPVSRHTFDAPVQIERAAAEESGEPAFVADAWALDFTVMGAMLLVEQPFEAGEEVLINLAPPTADPERVEVRVVTCERLVGSIHRLRVRFS